MNQDEMVAYLQSELSKIEGTHTGTSFDCYECHRKQILGEVLSKATAPAPCHHIKEVCVGDSAYGFNYCPYCGIHLIDLEEK